MSSLPQDIRYALRTMRKAPGFTAVAILTLALGIGANTAIFSIVNALLLKPLPYPDADRLVMVWQDLRARGGPATEWTGPANHFDLKTQTQIFSGVTTIRGWNASLADGSVPEALSGEQTTYEYFDVLGVRPALGRTFRPSDDVPNARRVVMLSHALWARRFGSDPAAVGRVVSINGEPHEIIGVMPDAFRPALAPNANVWRPLRWNPVNAPRALAISHTVARLQPGVSLEAARSALSLLAKRLEHDYPETNTGNGLNPEPLQEVSVGGRRLALLVLLGAVGFVLLIACVNLANLLLARGSARARELAVRRALGADRARIVRQLLTESVLLGMTGGAVGVLCGVWGMSALKALAPAGTPRMDEVTIDLRVLVFAAILAAATGLLFGLVPAWQASSDRLASTLKDGLRTTAGTGGARARRVLIVAELALALVLLVGSGLLLRTFVALQRADLGFTSHGVLTGFVLPPPAAYRTADQRRAFYDRLLERAAALPGVQQAALSSVIPLGGDSDTNFSIEGRPPARSNADALITWYRDVSASYFSAMNIPLRRGRLFTAGEAAPVVVINETMAKRFWPTDDPIGQRLDFGDKRLFTIVGIVADVQVRGARGTNEVETYVPYWQAPEAGTNLVLKCSIAPAVLIEPMKQAVKDVDPTIAVAGIASMEAIVGEANGQPRFYATMVGAFAGLALLLAAVGVYGVMAYSVSQRTSEIGVRLALGAGQQQICRLVLGDSLRLAAVGLVCGAAGALAAGRAIRSLLFGVRSGDPVTYVATAALLVGVALLASYLPARRAMRIDPMTALRTE
jgi:predicted permease